MLQVICPDKWKEGAQNTTESGGRKVRFVAVPSDVALVAVLALQTALLQSICTTPLFALFAVE